MTRITMRVGLLAAICVLSATAIAYPCSLCSSNLQSQTIRQDAAQAKLVLFGTLTKADLRTNTTTFKIHTRIKSDPFLKKNQEVIELPRYVPIADPARPPQFLIFCDVYRGKLDPYRGTPVQSSDIVEYVNGALQREKQKPADRLLYFFQYLDHPDPQIANDAFLEFAKAADSDIGLVAPKLSAAKLREWVKDPKTPSYKLSLYAFLLGSCGDEKDAFYFHRLLKNPTEKYRAALDGIVGGYIQLRPTQGWELVNELLRDPKKPFTERFAVIRALRFFYNWKPDKYKKQVLAALQLVLQQGDIADLAIEDLRRWKLWDLTDQVLSKYGKKSHDVPVVQRSIIRYALSCPLPEAKHFVAEVRRRNPDLVRDLEMQLQ